MNMWFIFWRSLKRRATFITFLLFGNDVFSLISRPLIFVNFYKRVQSIQEQVNILNNTRPSIKEDVKPFSEEILFRVEVIASSFLI